MSNTSFRNSKIALRGQHSSDERNKNEKKSAETVVLVNVCNKSRDEVVLDFRSPFNSVCRGNIWLITNIKTR